MLSRSLTCRRGATPAFNPLCITLKPMLSKRRFRLLAVLTALLFAASISFSRARTLDVVAERQASIETVYVAYSYEGHRLNFHGGTYQAAPLALLRGAPTGRITVPARFHVHLPFPLESHPWMRIDLVYVPRIHNALGPILEGTGTQPGFFEIDASQRHLTMFDLGEHPDRWKRAVGSLSYVLQRIMGQAPREIVALGQQDPATAALTLELIGHFQREYDSFVARYGDVPRPIPTLPDYARLSWTDKQKQEWAQMVETDLAREPRWGDLVKREYEDQLRALNETAALLR